jgi:hypothetical protein
VAVVAGVGEPLVGVTDWCLEPAEALAGLARVRGTENPDLAAIRGLEPDLVVADAEENRKLDVQRLEAALTAGFVTMPTAAAGAVAELLDERVLADGRLRLWGGARPAGRRGVQRHEPPPAPRRSGCCR